MAHAESSRTLAYRRPEIIHLGDAVSLTEGSAERKWDGAGSTGWQENWPEATRPRNAETKKNASKKNPIVK